ncbi:MAG: hypothetical protein ACOYMA_15505 [Bacteroidia bacterium]
MSVTRVCRNCFRPERFRVNFGENSEAEREFHQKKWCDCGYNSPEEMMQDQDLGFNDPRWVGISILFLNDYYLRISQGQITNKDEHVRFFLKLLKSSMNNYRVSAELVNKYDDKDYWPIFNGKTEKVPKLNIFDNSLNLKHVPKEVAIVETNKKLFMAHKRLEQDMKGFESKVINRNRWIAGLTLLLIIVGIVAVIN